MRSAMHYLVDLESAHSQLSATGKTPALVRDKAMPRESDRAASSADNHGVPTWKFSTHFLLYIINFSPKHY